MKGESFSFPYPVLGIGDSMSGDFAWTAAVKFSREKITLSLNFELLNHDLTGLLESGKAAYILRVQCAQTFYREQFILVDSQEQVELAASGLRESVEMAPFIVAIKPIKKYSPRSGHRDYKGVSHQILPGTVLAIAPKAYFIADKEFSSSKKKIRSLMEFVRNTIEEAKPEYRFGSERIEIYLNSDDWDIYQRAKGSAAARNIIHSSVVFPVLLEALANLDNQDYAGLAWRDRLAVLIREKGLDDKEIFDQASGLLKNPISRGFQGLNSILDELEEDGYE